MPIRRWKRLTKAQLIGYFNDYRSEFPDWAVEHEVVLVRALGPIRQHIAFERLSIGAYRPMCSIHVIGPPGGAQLLPRFLDVKHREVSPRQHAAMWRPVLKAMEEQFVPPVRKPLELAEVLALAEDNVMRYGIGSVNCLCALATLNAHARQAGTCSVVVQWAGAVDRSSWARPCGLGNTESRLYA